MILGDEMEVGRIMELILK